MGSLFPSQQSSSQTKKNPLFTLTYSGRHHFQLPIRALRYPVYDVNGRLISMDNRKDVTGELTFTVDVPPIADNIAGIITLSLCYEDLYLS